MMAKIAKSDTSAADTAAAEAKAKRIELGLPAEDDMTAEDAAKLRDAIGKAGRALRLAADLADHAAAGRLDPDQFVVEVDKALTEADGLVAEIDGLLPRPKPADAA